MSMKRMLLAAGAAIASIAALTDASAQSRRYQEPTFNRYGYGRPPVAQPVRASKLTVVAARTAAPVARRPVEQAPQRAPAPEVPLSAEQLAAKAEVDGLFAREPALAAAKQRPDPKLAKAAAGKHDAQEKKLAALQARQAAEAAKRKEMADKLKSRDDTKAAAIKAKPGAQPKNKAAAPADAEKSRPDVVQPVIAPVVPPQPLLRMPTPDALPQLSAQR